MLYSEKPKILVISSSLAILQEIERRSIISPNFLLHESSPKIRRTFRLLRKKRITLGVLFRIYHATQLRDSFNLKNSGYTKIKNESDLLDIVHMTEPTYLFSISSGLILNVNQYPTSLMLLNIHCASLPKYAGLAAIPRALANRDLNQEAVMHRMTNVIDNGEVVLSNPYVLELDGTLNRNYQIAVSAGLDLLNRFVKRL